MSKNTKANKPPYYAWQTNPANLTTPQIQVWSKSGTMRGVISSETATDLVKRGTHFVMCCQAIGEI